MKKILFLVIFFIPCTQVFAQYGRAGFLSTGRGGVSTSLASDYQAVGINPANVGLKSDYPYYATNLGLMEIAASIYSNGLSRKNLWDLLLRKGKLKDYEAKQKAAKQFSNSDFVFNMDFMKLGVSHYHGKVGGFGFKITDRIRWYSHFNSLTSQIAFLGYGSDYFQSIKLFNKDEMPNSSENIKKHGKDIAKGFDPLDTMTISKITEGSTIQFSWLRAYNMNYAKKFAFSDKIKLSIGIGAKFIRGFGYINIQSDGENFKGKGAFNPLMEIDFGKAAKNNPSAVNRTTNTKLGKGWGLDGGFNLIIDEHLRIAGSVINYGKVNWHTNLYELKNNKVTKIKTKGINNYNIFFDADNFGGKRGVFEYKGLSSFTTPLPLIYRAGISYTQSEFYKAGADVIIPGNNLAGNYQQNAYSIGFEYHKISGVKIFSGVNYGGNYINKINISLGSVFVFENWEIGMTIRDVTTFMGSSKPHLSASIGLIRAGITL